MIIVIVQPVE